MNNHGHGETYGWLLLYGALVLVGFHIDFALVLLAVAHRYRRRK
jgi:hypothetical protein